MKAKSLAMSLMVLTRLTPPKPQGCCNYHLHSPHTLVSCTGLQDSHSEIHHTHGSREQIFSCFLGRGSKFFQIVLTVTANKAGSWFPFLSPDNVTNQCPVQTREKKWFNKSVVYVNSKVKMNKSLQQLNKW